MPFYCRCQWEKRDRVRVLVDDEGGLGSVHYAAKDAISYDVYSHKFDSGVC